MFLLIASCYLLKKIHGATYHSYNRVELVMEDLTWCTSPKLPNDFPFTYEASTGFFASEEPANDWLNTRFATVLSIMLVSVSVHSDLFALKWVIMTWVSKIKKKKTRANASRWLADLNYQSLWKTPVLFRKDKLVADSHN